ncbi:Cro/CI family transcriptional regulator [Yokenella regensburgei]|uniref:Cro/CI family transcriptional regulator n=1 Tax=Yokenella regensburgei TaxID=158877 RepID=UPI0013759B2A|nr:Cro/CI family transcriptional regulator [Yokenella regensburgei]KAF1368747.1 DNA-binding transcriptional regulator YdaS (Cro superfamily) [Yokenella regensburgei]
MEKSSVVVFYGSQRKVAKAIGISDQAVSAWPEIIPKGAALELEKLTDGALKCDLSLYKNRPRKNKHVNA